MLKSLYLWIECRQTMVLCLSEFITPLPFVVILLGFHAAPQETDSSLGLSCITGLEMHILLAHNKVWCVSLWFSRTI